MGYEYAKYKKTASKNKISQANNNSSRLEIILPSFYDYFKKKLEIKEFQHVFMEVINKIPRLTFELIAVLICLLIVQI